MDIASADLDQPLTGQPPEPVVLAAVKLLHRWADRSPRALYGKALIVCYRVLDNGAVTRQLLKVVDRDGNPIPAPRRSFPGLDWSEAQEHGGREGTGHPMVLKVTDPDDAEAALLTWLEDVGLLAGDD